MAGSIADILPPPKGVRATGNALVTLPKRDVADRGETRTRRALLKRPPPSVVEETRQQTQAIVDRILAGPEAPPQDIQTHLVAEKELIIVPQKQDPLEPPRHRHVKSEKTTDAYHAPVMRPEPMPLTKQQLEEWSVPPSISNWKNPKSRVASLDQRIRQPHPNGQVVSDRQSKLAAALHSAESTRHEEIQIRAAEQDQRRQNKLEELAARARTKAHHRPGQKRERDWAERSALGELPAAKKEVQFDSRLFNRRPHNESILAPAQAARELYRPKNQNSEGARLGPVEFEEETV